MRRRCHACNKHLLFLGGLPLMHKGPTTRRERKRQTQECLPKKTVRDVQHPNWVAFVPERSAGVRSTQTSLFLELTNPTAADRDASVRLRSLFRRRPRTFCQPDTHGPSP